MSLIDQLKKEEGSLLAGQTGAESEEGTQGGLSSIVTGQITELLRQHGLSNILERFRANGLGNLVASWVGTGENQPISPDQVHQGLGADLINQISARLGIPTDQIAPLLARFLPGVVDKMTPNGVVEEPAAVAPSSLTRNS